jgi:hypothetical protein
MNSTVISTVLLLLLCVCFSFQKQFVAFDYITSESKATSPSDSLDSVIVLPDDSKVICGSTVGQISFQNVNVTLGTAETAFVAKFSKTNQLLWIASIPMSYSVGTLGVNSANAYSTCNELTSINNTIFITGTLRGSTNIKVNGTNKLIDVTEYFFIASMNDTNGSFNWFHTNPTGDKNYQFSITSHSDKVYVCGTVRLNNIALGGTTLKTNGADMLLIVLGSKGNYLLVKNFGGESTGKSVQFIVFNTNAEVC